MPQFKLSDDDRKALVIFLKSRRGVKPLRIVRRSVPSWRRNTTPPVPESVAAVAASITAAATPAARGEQLIEGYACLSCHKLGDHDGGISPDLTYEGLVRETTG